MSRPKYRLCVLPALSFNKHVLRSGLLVDIVPVILSRTSFLVREENSLSEQGGKATEKNRWQEHGRNAVSGGRGPRNKEERKTYKEQLSLETESWSLVHRRPGSYSESLAARAVPVVQGHNRYQTPGWN